MSKFEQFLAEMGPLIKAVDAPPEKTPDDLRAALRRVPVQQPPLILTPALFKVHVLRVLKDSPMDGFALCRKLEEQNIVVDANGRGELYKLLHRLERERLLEVRWRELGTEMTKTYHVVKKGEKILENHPDLLTRAMNLFGRPKLDTSSSS